MYRKELFYRGLDQLPVYIEDTLQNSPYYFNIVDIPKVFGPGKNSIRFNLNENNLDIYNNVDVEIIDSYGNTVYHEAPEYFQRDEENIRVLTVFLYDDISNGPLTITFVGYAKAGLNGEEVPEEFKDKYNVRYTTIVDYNRFQKNTSRLLFSQDPSISISEARTAYVSRSLSPLDTVTVSGSGIYRYQQSYPLLDLPAGKSFINDMLNGTLILTGSSILPDFSGYTTSSFNIFNSRISNIYNSQVAILNIPWTASILGQGSSPSYGLVNNANVNYTLTYNPTPNYTPINNFKSFINLKISNLDPASGYLKYIKLYGKSQGSLDQYELLGESQTIDNELLINSASYTQFDRSNVGYFLNTSSFQSFWNYNNTYLSASFNTSSLFNSLYLNPQVDTTLNNVLFTSNVDINFQKESSYRLYFNYVRDTNFILEVYMSGSAFINKEGNGQKVFYLDSSNFGPSYLNFPIDFLATQTGTGRLQFKIITGSFYISDISLKSGVDQGFNPSNFNSYFPINVKNRNDVYDFKVDFIDDNNQINSYEFDNAGASNIQVSGSNQFISGCDNLIPGCIRLGNSLQQGIHLDGQNNQVTTYNNSTGWVMWSGSQTISGSSQPGSGFYFETGAPFNHYIKATVGGQIQISGSVSGATGGTSVDTGSFVTTSSFNSFTSSINNFTSSINNITSSFVTTSSFNNFTSSINSFTSSINNFTSSINNATGSFATTSSNTFNGNQIINGSLIVTNGISGSLIDTGSFVTTSSFNTYTSSINSFTSSINNKTGSFTTTSSFNSFTSSINNATGSLVTTSSFNNFTSSINSFTSSINNFTSSINNKTGSFVTTSSFNNFTSSINNFTSSINNITSSFATTGSNTFNGNQIITGSLSNGAATQAQGDYSHAEGSGSRAVGNYSHAEGEGTIANRNYSHAEGIGTIANGNYSHAEGIGTTANGYASHAEGYATFANGDYSHAEGESTTANGNNSHAEGSGTTAQGNYSHAEGENTTANGYASHAEGLDTIANGDYSHAEGLGTIASGSYQTVVGKYNKQNNSSLFIIGNGISDDDRSDIVLVNNNNIVINGSLVVTNGISGSLINTGSFVTTSSFNNFTSSINSFTSSINNKTGSFVTTSSFNNFTSSINNKTGSFTTTSSFNNFTSSINSFTSSINNATSSFATTSSNTFNGNQNIIGSLSNGLNTNAYGDYSHAEGNETQASGEYSHAEGESTQANGHASHAEGYATIAQGDYSHAEGLGTTAVGNYSHAEGEGTIASGSGETVVGKYNKQNNTSSLFIIGNGTDNYNRNDLVLFNTSSVEISGSLIVNNQTLPAINTLISSTQTGSFATTSSLYYIGTTPIYLNRTSSNQNLYGINIDGNAITAGTAGTVLNTNLGATAIGVSQFISSSEYSKPAGYQGYLVHSSIGLPAGVSGWLAYNVVGKRDVEEGTFATLTSQNGSMWFGFALTSSVYPTWTKIQTVDAFNAISSSFTTTSSFNNFTSSINNATGSFVTTSSFNTYTSSVQSAINSIGGKANLVGGNTFSGDQTISGSLEFTAANTAITSNIKITDIQNGNPSTLYQFNGDRYRGAFGDMMITDENDPTRLELVRFSIALKINNSGVLDSYSVITSSADLTDISFSTDISSISNVKIIASVAGGGYTYTARISNVHLLAI